MLNVLEDCVVIPVKKRTNNQLKTFFLSKMINQGVISYT